MKTAEEWEAKCDLGIEWRKGQQKFAAFIRAVQRDALEGAEKVADGHFVSDLYTVSDLKIMDAKDSIARQIRALIPKEST